MPSFAADGFRQSYLDAGQGVPLVALHGFPLDGSMWRFQVEALSHLARWIVPDLRGFGASVVDETPLGPDGLPAPRTPALFADDVARLLDELEIERAVICGLSMGGYVAFEFERRHRDRLAGLILCDTRPDADPPARVADRRTLAAETMERGSSVIAEAYSPKLFAKKTRVKSPEKVDEIFRMMQNAEPTAIAATSLGLAQRTDASDRLAGIEVPTLVVCGEEDLISPPDAMREFADAIPNARFVLVPDAGHLAPFERPEPVNATLAEFLRRSFDETIAKS